MQTLALDATARWLRYQPRGLTHLPTLVLKSAAQAAAAATVMIGEEEMLQQLKKVATAAMEEETPKEALI